MWIDHFIFIFRSVTFQTGSSVTNKIIFDKYLMTHLNYLACKYRTTQTLTLSCLYLPNNSKSLEPGYVRNLNIQNQKQNNQHLLLQNVNMTPLCCHGNKLQQNITVKYKVCHVTRSIFATNFLSYFD